MSTAEHRRADRGGRQVRVAADERVWHVGCHVRRPSTGGAQMSARIGLIAVSGLRVQNQRLMRLGLTLPGFVERARVIASMPSLGLLTLAAVTPPDYDLTYLEAPGAVTPPGDFDLVAISSFTAKSDVMYALAGRYRARGCPLDCEFCAASKVFGGYKRKPVERVARELAEVRRVLGVPFIELADDNTFVDKAWSRALVRTLAEAGVHWFTETDVSVADDVELLDLLAASGCRQVLIGFESPRAQSLRGLEAHDWKARRHPRYRRTIDAIQGRGISVNGCFILGLDADTPDGFPAIERFVQDSGLM